KDQLLVGGDDIDLDRRIIGGDQRLPFTGHGAVIAHLVQVDADVFQSLDGLLTDQGAHLADAGGKDHRIQLAHGGHEGADVFLQAIGFDFQRQLAAYVSGNGVFDYIPAVGKAAGDAHDAALLVEDAVDLLGGEVFLLHHEGRDGRVDVAAAGAHDGPLQRGQSHGGVHRYTILDVAMGNTVADVHGDDVAF